MAYILMDDPQILGGGRESTTCGCGGEQRRARSVRCQTRIDYSRNLHYEIYRSIRNEIGRVNAYPVRHRVLRRNA